MDDRQEQMTADVKNIGQFCYVSSWADDERESIPMWNMYASLPFGVRIRLRANPFLIYSDTAQDIAKALNLSCEDDQKECCFKSLISHIEMISNRFYSPQARSMKILSKIEYTDDPDLLCPHILAEGSNDELSIQIGKLGKYKNIHWTFQNEWRYVMNFIPFNMNQPVDKIYEEYMSFAIKVRLGLAKQPFPYYDLRISEEAFREMEITLSPQISAGNRAIVDCLVEKYNPHAKVIESSLLGLI